MTYYKYMNTQLQICKVYLMWIWMCIVDDCKPFNLSVAGIFLFLSFFFWGWIVTQIVLNTQDSGFAFLVMGFLIGNDAFSPLRAVAWCFVLKHLR